MEEGLKKLYSGDFNSMKQYPQEDGSVVIRLSSNKYPEAYEFRVKDLYGENEEVLEHEVIQPATVPEHIKARMEEAKRAEAAD